MTQAGQAEEEECRSQGPASPSAAWEHTEGQRVSHRALGHRPHRGSEMVHSQRGGREVDCESPGTPKDSVAVTSRL